MTVRPPRPGRPGPSRGQLAFRRFLALFVLLAMLGVGVWVAAKAVGSVTREAAPPPPTTTTGPPPPKPLRIIFPEGFTRAQMAQRVTAVNKIASERRKVKTRITEEAYLRLTASHALPGRFAGDAKARPLEGFLFPATYEFLPQTTTRQLVAMQLEAFERNWAKVDLAYAKSKNLTEYDVLIIASMIEKETVAPEERPLVSAVIYNRLKIGLPLGIDATIRYGLGVPATESLRQSHLQSDNPYNTRRFQGLPPTPIANPGLASMQAAAHPAQVDYLYFARKPNDRAHHFFTADEDEFLQYLCENGYGCG